MGSPSASRFTKTRYVRSPPSPVILSTLWRLAGEGIDDVEVGILVCGDEPPVRRADEGPAAERKAREGSTDGGRFGTRSIVGGRSARGAEHCDVGVLVAGGVECTGGLLRGWNAEAAKGRERSVPGGASGAGADEVNDLELPHDDDKQLLRQLRPVDGCSGDRCSSGALSSTPAHRWAWGGG